MNDPIKQEPAQEEDEDLSGLVENSDEEDEEEEELDDDEEDENLAE